MGHVPGVPVGPFQGVPVGPYQRVPVSPYQGVPVGPYQGVPLCSLVHVIIDIRTLSLIDTSLMESHF